MLRSRPGGMSSTAIRENPFVSLRVVSCPIFCRLLCATQKIVRRLVDTRTLARTTRVGVARRRSVSSWFPRVLFRPSFVSRSLFRFHREDEIRRNHPFGASTWRFAIPCLTYAYFKHRPSNNCPIFRVDIRSIRELQLLQWHVDSESTNVT